MDRGGGFGVYVGSLMGWGVSPGKVHCLLRYEERLKEHGQKEHSLTKLETRRLRIDQVEVLTY